MILSLISFVGVGLLPGAPAHATVDDMPGSSERAARITRIQTAVPEFTDDTRLSAIRTVGQGVDSHKKKTRDTRARKKATKTVSRARERAHPLPQQIEYRFGARTFVVLDTNNRALKSIQSGKGLATVSDLSDKSVLLPLQAGCLPETELALATIQDRLDVHHQADKFFLFLESWRNPGPVGSSVDESFYEALDRTAGTDDAVFFYDVMLADFVTSFAPQGGKKWSLQERHDALLKAFLTVRQYRGFIEAASYALVLPADVPLPARLSRYDYGTVLQDQFSFRHQLNVLTEMNGGDIALVVDLLQQHLREHALPDPLWSTYNPVQPFGTLFTERLTRFVYAGIVPGADGQVLFKRHQDRTSALARRIREAAGT